MSASDLHGASEDLQELTGAYCDGTLSGDQCAALEQLLLADAAARRFFRSYLALDADLHDHGMSASGHWLSSAPTRAPSPTVGRKAWTKPTILAMTGALILAVTAATILVLLKRTGTEPQALAKLQQVTGDVRILTAGGQVRAISADARVDAGDTIRTRDGQSSTVVAYPDGTQLTLIGNTSVTCGDGGAKAIVVHHGTLAAAVRPQPEGKPMVFATSLAQVRVLGTSFLIEAVANRTDLSVSEGRVWLTRIKDGKGVEVSDGAYAVLTDQDELQVQSRAALPSSWSVDFEEGRPEGWDAGELTSEGLPSGSRGAMKAVNYTDQGGDPVYGIRSNEAWVQGLFAVTKTSTLHIRFKMEQRTWINLFVCTRTTSPKGPTFSGNFIFNDPLKTTPGRWQTVSIPLASFKSLQPGSEPLDRVVPFKVIVTAGEADSNLIIDRIWVTPDGPATTTIEAAE